MGRTGRNVVTRCGRVGFWGVGVLIVALATSPEAVAAHASSKLSYKVTFTISKGSYGTTSTFNVGGGGSESDNFQASSHYQITIPKRGHVPNLTRASSVEDFKPDSTGVPAWENVSDGGFDCVGDLYSDPTLPPVFKGQQADGALTFTVEMARRVLIEHATNRHGQYNCGAGFDGLEAFSEAYAKYMPQMLTASSSVPVSALRGLQKGDTESIKVNAAENAVDRPPRNCSGEGVECSQQLGWKGEVNFTRVT